MCVFAKLWKTDFIKENEGNLGLGLVAFISKKIFSPEHRGEGGENI